MIDGRYRIIEALAAGGMGEVYRAEHLELGKHFAVKVMRPELSQDPEFVARFKREAIASSRIGHQHIVDISDFGRTEEGRFYFVMEFLEGQTLTEIIRADRILPPQRAVHICAQIARALSADSRTVMRPSGLSSRTTSPVSVTHDVVRRPANSMSTRNAGTGTPAPRTSSRRPTSTTTGEFLSVAGSNMVH